MEHIPCRADGAGGPGLDGAANREERRPPCGRVYVSYTPHRSAVKDDRGNLTRSRTLMRILLLADIHGNWPALQAVAAEPFDLCLCLGDLVDYGLDPAPCLDWVRRRDAHAVRGNHDHGAAQNVVVQGRSG